MSSADLNKIQRVAYAQLILYLAVWVFGIYINGFEPSPQATGESTVSFFFSPIVITHFVLGALTAAVGIILLTLGWVYKLKKFVLFTGLSLASIAVAASGGLTFVFGPNQNFDSLLMASAFITALYLSFAALLASRSIRIRKSNTLVLSLFSLGLFYLVFLSGMYLNLYVASSVFSEPPVIAQKMLQGMVTSPAALFHEISGLLLLALVVTLTVSLLRSRFTNLGVLGVVTSLLVTYSLLQGVLSNIAPIFEANSVIQTGTITSVVEPMLSAAGFLIAILLAMRITQLITFTKQKAL